MMKTKHFPKLLTSKLIDRKDPLEKISYLISMARKGKGTVVNLVGDAGVGKSQLITEIKQQGQLDEFFVIESRAIQLGNKIGFYPLIEIIKNLAGILEYDAEPIAAQKLRDTIHEIYPEKCSDLYPFIATLVGYQLFDQDAERISGITGRNLSKLIFKSIRELVIRRSKISPLVFIMEDMHWSDASSIEFLVEFFKLAEEYPILFINVFRPVLGSTGEKLLRFIREDHPSICVEILLKNLNRNGTDQLIQNILSNSHIPDHINQKLFENSKGNPLFIKQILNLGAFSGEIIEKDGEYHLTDQTKSILEEREFSNVIQKQFEMIDVPEQNLLKILSVSAGRIFFKVLEILIPYPDQLSQLVHQLEQQGIICRYFKNSEVRIGYANHTIKESILQMISDDEKKELHLSIANALEKNFEDNLKGHYSILAHHYQEGGDRKKALQFLIKAGGTAFKASALGRALTYYKYAADWLNTSPLSKTDQEQLSVLEEKIGLIYYHKGYYIEAIDFLDLALQHMKVGKKENKFLDPIKLFYHTVGLLIKLYGKRIQAKKVPTKWEERYFRILVYQGRALSCTNPKRMLLGMIKGIKESFRYDISKSKVLLHVISSASLFFSYSGLSLKTSRKIIQYVEKQFPKDSTGYHNYLLDTAHLFYNLASGNWDVTYREDVIDQGLYYGDLFDASSNMLFVGNIFIEQGRFDLVKKILRKLEEVNNGFNDPLVKYNWKILLTHYLLKTRKLSEASSCAQEANIIGYKLGLDVDRVNVLGMKLQSEVLANDIQKASRTLENIQDLIQIEPLLYLPQYYMSYLVGALRYHLYFLERSIENGDQKEKTRHEKKLIELGTKAVEYSGKYALYNAEIYQLLGKINGLLGDWSKAFENYQISLKIGRKLGAELECARTQFEVGKMLSSKMVQTNLLDGKSGEQHFEEAKEIFNQHYLNWDLVRLERYLDVTPLNLVVSFIQRG